MLLERHALLHFAHELLHKFRRSLSHTVRGYEEGRLGAQVYIEKNDEKRICGKHLTGNLIVQEEVTGGDPRGDYLTGKSMCWAKSCLDICGT